MSVRQRDPEAVLRQFTRAVWGDQFVGDEVWRVVAAHVKDRMAAHPGPAALEDWLGALLSLSLNDNVKSQPIIAPAPFSDAALRDAAMPQADPVRLSLLMSDLLGVPDKKAMDLAGLAPKPQELKAARAQLAVPPGLKALVIEDEPLVSAELVYILQQLGLEHSARAETVDRALEQATATPPDIILADYDLEGAGTGADAIKAIRQISDCPVVFVTGHADAVLSGADFEPDFVIDKPFKVDAIRLAVAHALEGR